MKDKEKQYSFILDQTPHKTDEQNITGIELKQLAEVDPVAYEVWQELKGKNDDILVQDNTSVDLGEKGTEKFYTIKKQTTEG